MRAEDQLKAEEEEEAQEIIQGLDEGRDDEQAEEQAVEALPEAARHFNYVVATMRTVLEGRAVDLSELAELGRDERLAFETLQQVVSARGRRGGFIYAEQRIERLNQVLAVLQPALSLGSVPGVEELRSDLEIVVDEIDSLRHKLASLEASEEELESKPLDVEAEGDKDDDDDEDDDEATSLAEVPEPGAPPRPSILTGNPAAPDKVAPPTTLEGPPVPDRVSPPTTLTGSPPAPDLPVRPTTLTDEADAAEPAASSAPSPSPPSSPSSSGAPEPTPTKPARARKVK